MFFILSKIIGALLKPLFWVIVLMLFGLWKRTYLKKAVWLSFIIVYFFGNSFIANKVMTAYESPMQYLQEDDTFEYAVVLGGFSRNRLKNGRLEFNESGDRLIAALDFLRTGKVQKIIISGGDGSLYKTGIDEASEVLAYLKSVGYNQDNIIIEPESKNTYQNAVNTSKLLPKGASVLLITSAFHMPRSEKCFRKQGIAFKTFPVDYLMDGSTPYSPSGMLIPNGAAMNKWEILIKEWVGLAAYKLSGKI
jgi:uncharacterized SAM-binding protein YcdF (DUF218 family)